MFYFQARYTPYVAHMLTFIFCYEENLDVVNVSLFDYLPLKRVVKYSLTVTALFQGERMAAWMLTIDTNNLIRSPLEQIHTIV